MTSRFLFVYGSMSEGMVHFGRIKDFVVSIRPATIRARAYRLKVGYPVLVNEPHCLVSGQLLEIKSKEILLQFLDQFHGCNLLDPSKSLYNRVEVPAFIEGELNSIPVDCYFINPKKMPAGAVEIENGDWQSSLRDGALLTDKLTMRQRDYLMRLGAASGRDIVPINDMTLYRELMNLELIVDKGRRLALSKLGQEVYRHLS